MKKIVIALFAAALLAPLSFAKESEIVLKAGITPVSSLETDMTYEDSYGYYYWNSKNNGADVGYQGALEFFVYVQPYLGLGAGVNQQFTRNIHNLGDVSYTSLYFAVKPRMVLSSDGSQDMYGYVLGFLGFSFINSDFEIDGHSISANNGGYYGIGVGLQYHNVLFEVLYSLNTSSVDAYKRVGYYYYDSAAQYYSACYINLGYRFAIN